MNRDVFMHWFDLIFPPLMILGQPLICLLVPNRPDTASQAASAKRLRTTIWLLAFSSVAIYYLAYYFGGGGQWRQLWMLCFLQMPLIQKLFAAQNPQGATPYTEGTRVASLVNRRRSVPIPIRAWVIAWSVWALLSSLSLWGCLRNDLPTRLDWMLAMYALGTAVLLAFGPKLVSLTAYEAEPVDANNSPALAAAYKKHRNARRWLFFAMPTLMMTTFGACSVAIAWFATSPAAEAKIGLYGGVAGSVVGIAGGIVGTCFGMWRMKLNQAVHAASE